MGNNSKPSVENTIMLALKGHPRTMHELCMTYKHINLWDMGKSLRKLTMLRYIEPECITAVAGQSIPSMGWNFGRISYKLARKGVAFCTGDPIAEMQLTGVVRVEKSEPIKVQQDMEQTHTRTLGPTTPKTDHIDKDGETWEPFTIHIIDDLKPFDIVRISGKFYTFMGLCGIDKSAANYPSTPKGNLHMRPLGENHGPTFPPEVVQELFQIGSVNVWRKQESKSWYATLWKSYDEDAQLDITYTHVKPNMEQINAVFERKKINGAFYWITLKNLINKSKARMTDQEFNEFLASIL